MSFQSASRNEKPAVSVPLFLGAYKGMIHPDLNDPLLLEALADPESLARTPGAEMLLEGRNKVFAKRLSLSCGGQREVVVKEFSVRGFNRLKSRFLPSKAARAWRGAVALAVKGIPTPKPLAYLERRRRGFLVRCFFLAERVVGLEEIRRFFRELPENSLPALLASLARFLRSCHDAGIKHRDLSDGNILVGKEEAEDAGRAPSAADTASFRFYLLDTNRIRLRQRLGPLLRVKNLIRLGVPAGLQKFFLAQYFGGNHPPSFLWLWYKLNKTAYTWYVRFKKTLRLRRIAKRLKIQ